MNSGDIIYNHDQIVSELLSVKRPGGQELVPVLEQSDFFSRRVDDSDPGEGSLANFCLWVLRLARDTMEYASTRGGCKTLDPDGIVLVSLLHKVHQCRLKICSGKETSQDQKIQTLLRKTGLVLEPHELKVLLSDGPIEGASIDSKDPACLLSHIISGAKKNASDYASGIPYSEKPLEKVLPRPLDIYPEVFMDEDDHRLWWNMSYPDFKSYDSPELEGYLKIQTTALLPLVIGAGSTEGECAVLCDESGVMGFLAGYTREDDGTVFMRSDRLCFGYSDMVFFLSRYPHYRPSYVVAQRTDGKWGAFSIKASGKKRPPIVDVVPLVRHESRNRDAAIRAMKTKAGYPARVRHHLFYNEISVMDCFLAD